MKKYLSLLLTVLAVLLVILASCVGDNPAPTDTAETTAATDPETTLAPETTQNVTEAPETDPETVPEPETTAEVTAEETTVEEPTDTAEPETETEPPKTNVAGDCGNVNWRDSDKKVGQPRLDQVKHEILGTDYAKAVNKGTNWTVTVKEASGMIQLYGWVGFSFEDFELGWRIGTDSETPYTTVHLGYTVQTD